jgi:hypothetical protein
LQLPLTSLSLSEGLPSARKRLSVTDLVVEPTASEVVVIHHNSSHVDPHCQHCSLYSLQHCLTKMQNGLLWPLLDQMPLQLQQLQVSSPASLRQQLCLGRLL